jgi:hypothetical protein
MNFNGNLRLAECDENGIVTGAYIGLLNPVKVELVTPAAENVDEVSRLIDSAGQLLSRGQIPKFTSANISTSSLRDKRVLAYAMNGRAVGFAQAANIIAVQTGSTVTAEAVTAGALGTPIQLAKHHVSAVAVKHTSGSPTYTLGTDYSVDANLGQVTPLVGGVITASQALKVDYVAATTAAEAVTAGQIGDWIKLANRRVSNVVVKNSGATTTYTAGVDYIVDTKPGFIKPIPGGAIAEDQDLKVSYTCAALAGTTVQGSVVPSKLLRVELQLADLVDQSESYLVIPLYQAASAGNKDLMGKAVINADLQGAMLVPPEGTAIATETGGAPYIITSLAA